MKQLLTSLPLILAINFSSAYAENDVQTQELAKKSQNPVGNIISIPFEFRTYDDTDSGLELNSLMIKPVYPMDLGEDYILINRFIIPVIDVENKGDSFQLSNSSTIPAGADRTGLGNIQYQSFVTSSNPGAVIYGVGLALELPTHAGNLGTDKYSAGPTAIVLSMPGKWVIGALAQNLWDVGGPGDDDINQFLFQYFINYNISNGWYLTTTPTMTADWEADSGNRWTIPVGGGVGKLHKFGGKVPVDFKLQAYSNVEKPSGGSDWSVMFSVKFLLPKGR